jgi:hypothetical protein
VIIKYPLITNVLVLGGLHAQVVNPAMNYQREQGSGPDSGQSGADGRALARREIPRDP